VSTLSTVATVCLAVDLIHYKNSTADYQHVIFANAQIENLKTILQRALNTWPEAPKELFDLDQLLRFGEVLQPDSKELWPAPKE
jgi:hypothetical protein